MKGLLKQQTLKQPESAQMDKVLYKWFTTMCSEGKPMTGPNDNWRELVLLQANDNNWQVHILWVLAAIF